MDSRILDFLKGLGYVNLPSSAYGIIKQCDDWYRAKEEQAHGRMRIDGTPYQMAQMAFAKRCCADDANLCEIIEINAGGGNEAQEAAVSELFQDNAFDTVYRRQLELCSGEGTAAAYWRVEDSKEWQQGDALFYRGGRIRLNAIEAGGYIPLTVDGEDVTEAAFVGTDMVEGKQRITLMICTMPEGERYQYRTVVFDKDFQQLSDDTILLGEVKPFSVLRTACVNTLPDMKGFGMPKIMDAIPMLTGLDQAFTALLGDIDTADKIVLINELLCQFGTPGKDGEIIPITPNEQLKRRFVIYGRDKLPAEKSVISEIVPEIRGEQFQQVIELLLSMLSMMFGFGSRKYTFEQGRLETATQYIGERQDAMQELNRQRQESIRYVQELVRAGLWFLNTFQGANWDIDSMVEIEFDDSYITDKRTALEDMRNDVLSGIGGSHVRALYLKERYNLSDDEAIEWAAAEDEEG